MGKKVVAKVSEVVPPRSAVNQLMGLYIIVSFTLSLSWFLGASDFSFLWVFAIIFGLFVVWKTRLKDIVERNLEWHKEHYHRKRALRQEETAEWLNFLINRWWVFSAVSIEDLVKRRINERLATVKPTFIDHLELSGFTFGDITPSVRSVKVFECTDGVPGFKPASWSSITQPPVGLDKMSEYQIVLETCIASRCEDFRMVFKARVGSEKVGLNFDIAVEELRLKGTLQVIMHTSMEAAFPHITKATISFTELPEVWFNVKMLKAIHLTEIPLLKSWIHLNVMEGITKALVDPGKIDIPIARAGPVSALQFSPQKKQELAQGVLTIHLKGTPAANAGEEICYTRLRIGKRKRQTVEVPAAQSWEDCCSFFVYDLAREKLNIKTKCKRLLTTVTQDQHDLDLSSFPFQVTKLMNHEIDINDGSKLRLQMDYTPLPVINLQEQEPVNVLQRSGVLYVCVHCANNVIASDKSGTSDPYCVVFCDRRRVLTTPYILQNRSPSWESHTEMFVRDFAQTNLSFYVFDWDGTNTIDDDFLGSSNFSMSEKEPYVCHRALTLGYNKQDEGHVDNIALGQIIVSVVFRPVPSVDRSERYRLTSSTDSMNNNVNKGFLYTEDMVSPGTMSVAQWVQMNQAQAAEGGGRKLSRSHPVNTFADDPLKDQIFVDLTIIQAKDLTPMDRNGYSDPFCEVRMDSSKLFVTSVRKKTLTPSWNESVTFRMSEDSGMLEISLFDKDLFSNDFLGKLMLTLDQLKEISLKGCSEWFKLQHTKTGSLEISAVVTASDTVTKPVANSTSEHKEHTNTKPTAEDSSHSQTKGSSNQTYAKQTSLENEVFEKPANGSAAQTAVASQPVTDTVEEPIVAVKSQSVKLRNPRTSTPLKGTEVEPKKHRKSASDLQLDRPPSRSNSLNSFAAFEDVHLSTEESEPADSEAGDKPVKGVTTKEETITRNNNNNVQTIPEDFDSSLEEDRGVDKNLTAEPKGADADVDHVDESLSPYPQSPDTYELDTSYTLPPSPNGMADKLFNVKGKVLSVHGLKSNEGSIYCKIRVMMSHKHRLRQIFGNRVIAKSSLVRSSQPLFNVPFDIDRGVGISGDTLLKVDIKKEGKEHLASKAFPLKSLFQGPGGEADKVQQMLPLDNNLQVEVFLQHSLPDHHLIHRRSNGRMSAISRSFKK